MMEEPRCFICGLATSGMGDLREHLAVKHAEYGRHVCSVCPTFGAYSDEEVLKHGQRFRTHRISFNENYDEYKEELVEGFLKDCVEAMANSGQPSTLDREREGTTAAGLVPGEPMTGEDELKLFDAQHDEDTGAGVESCEQCGMIVKGDYTGHRTHVLEYHPPAVGVIAQLGDDQAYLRTAIADCFPTSSIRSDLTCQHAGCATEIELGPDMRTAQRKHIEEAHAPFNIHCPCCEKSMKNLAALSQHIFSSHKGNHNRPTSEQEAAIVALRAEVNKKSRELLPKCFPFGDPCSDPLLRDTIRKLLVEEGRLEPEPHGRLSRIDSGCLEMLELKRQQQVAARRRNV